LRPLPKQKNCAIIEVLTQHKSRHLFLNFKMGGSTNKMPLVICWV